MIMSIDKLGWKHGDCEGGIVTPEYRSWQNMLARCYDPRNKDFEYYGDRGIIVYELWQKDFASFLIDVGRRPSAKHTLGRKNGDGNYEPDNCEWQTRTEQARNRPKYNKLTLAKAREIRMLYDSRGYTHRELAREFGVNKSTISLVIARKIWKS